MTPLVSIIIPTKNSAATLAACLTSIKNQTYKNIEIIVVDNSSSDKTIAIAEQYTVKVEQCGNERSAQRNKGAEISTGQYLLFIDSDMELHTRVIQECVHAMRKSTTTQAIVIPEESFGQTFWAACKRFERSFYMDVLWMQAARFFKKSSFELIGGFDENMIAGEDFDIHNRIITLFGTQSIRTISSMIFHNEGSLSFRTLLKKKFYYGSNMAQYPNKPYNAHSFKNQSSIHSRLFLLTSRPQKIIFHPMLFLGTLYMKMGEFISGGAGYIAQRYNKYTA